MNKRSNYIFNVLKFYRMSATVGDHTYYMRRGKFCMRRRTSINKERILSDPAFKKFRNCSTQFGEASLLATSIYKQLPKKKRKFGVIGKLTGEIYKLIRAGMGRKKILCKIISEYFGIVLKKVEKNGSVTYNTMDVEVKLLASSYEPLTGEWSIVNSLNRFLLQKTTT